MFKYVFENEIDVILKNCVICEKWYYDFCKWIIYNRLLFLYSVNFVEYIWLKYVMCCKI